MHNPFHRRRAVIALAGAALLLAGAAGASAAGGPQPGSGKVLPAPAAALLANPATEPGSELQFIAVTPCRILATRVAGGALSNSARAFSATAPYAAQGGLADGCDIPTSAVSIEANVVAISQAGTAGFVTAYATGETPPTAAIVNYDATGPVGNMVVVPLNESQSFTLRTNRTAHLVADVAGYYVKPLYATIDARNMDAPVVFEGVESGLVSVNNYEENNVVVPGWYSLTFDRNVTSCVPAVTDYSFAAGHFLAADSTFSQDSTVVVHVADAAGDPAGTVFHVGLTC